MENKEEKNVDPVPYFIHEGTVTRLAQCNKRLLIALVVSVIVLFLNNIVWLIYEGVTEYVRQENKYEQTADP